MNEASHPLVLSRSEHCSTGSKKQIVPQSEIGKVLIFQQSNGVSQRLPKIVPQQLRVFIPLLKRERPCPWLHRKYGLFRCPEKRVGG